MQVDLPDFIRTGCFGAIALGAPIATVSAILGEPDTSAPFRGQVLFLRYGPLFLHWTFDADQLLKFIHLDLSLPFEDVSAFDLQLHGFRNGLPLGQAIDMLRSLGMPYSLEERRIKWDFIRLYAGCGVRLTFNDQQEEPGQPTGLIGLEYASSYPRPSD